MASAAFLPPAPPASGCACSAPRALHAERGRAVATVVVGPPLDPLNPRLSPTALSGAAPREWHARQPTALKSSFVNPPLMPPGFAGHNPWLPSGQWGWRAQDRCLQAAHDPLFDARTPVLSRPYTCATSVRANFVYSCWPGCWRPGAARALWAAGPAAAPCCCARGCCGWAAPWTPWK